MADTKISAFPAATSVNDADLIPIVQGGTNKKATRDLCLQTLGTTTQVTWSTDTGLVRSAAGMVKATDGSSGGGGVVLPARAAPTDAEGNLFNDSTQKAFVGYVDGVKQRLVGCLFTQTATVTVTNTVTETTLVGSGTGTATLPANFFVAGKTIRLTASGIYSGDAITPGHLQFRAKLGTVVVADSGTTDIAAALANRGWRVACDITCRTTGATGTVFAQGIATLSTNGTAAEMRDMENTAASAAIDMTGALAVALTATWETADTDNTVSCTNLILEVLN